MTARRLLSSIFLLSVPFLAFSNVFKQNPVHVASSAMTIRWETSDESGVAGFEVYRKEVRDGADWYRVQAVLPRHQSNSIYQIVDNEIFKNADRLLVYKVVAVDGNGTPIEAVQITVPFSTNGLTSAAKSTWGSIKAMFR